MRTQVLCGCCETHHASTVPIRSDLHSSVSERTSTEFEVQSRFGCISYCGHSPPRYDFGQSMCHSTKKGITCASFQRNMTNEELRHNSPAWIGHHFERALNEPGRITGYPNSHPIAKEPFFRSRYHLRPRKITPPQLTPLDIALPSLN